MPVISSIQASCRTHDAVIAFGNAEHGILNKGEEELMCFHVFPTAAFSDIVYWSPGLYLVPPIFLMDVEKREESKENPEAQKYILEAHWKFICKILDRAEHEIRWNGGSLRLF
jgi:hypothetical protein